MVVYIPARRNGWRITRFGRRPSGSVPLVRSDAEVEPAVAQVWSPRRNVELEAVPLPSRAVATVPLAIAEAATEIAAVPAAVRRPSSPTVKVATLDAEPYDAAVTAVAARVGFGNVPASDPPADPLGVRELERRESLPWHTSPAAVPNAPRAIEPVRTSNTAGPPTDPADMVTDANCPKFDRLPCAWLVGVRESESRESFPWQAVPAVVP
jgi:hypothetical protein